MNVLKKEIIDISELSLIFKIIAISFFLILFYLDFKILDIFFFNNHNYTGEKQFIELLQIPIVAIILPFVFSVFILIYLRILKIRTQSIYLKLIAFSWMPTLAFILLFILKLNNFL